LPPELFILYFYYNAKSLQFYFTWCAKCANF
jgi:hypothetical protein